ncbi:META domain-containing protein [Ornithinimicrobium cryptoxanthini]|uniref:META domain-containing protein n=1 Tax=Ornithinimicrobium cryptoxanthini TaxID=2934161 RepID=UPI0021178CCF|nr:META domain-containing protein [Ornithinimicrobium cryptoxanthini]
MAQRVATTRHTSRELLRAAVLTPVLVAGLALALSACANQTAPGDGSAAPEPSASTGEELAGRTFVSTGASGHELVDGSQVQLTFEATTLSARAGCNALFGDYAVEEQTLRVGAMGSTEMGCEQALMEQDQWLAAFLEAGPTVRVDGDELTLSGEEAELVLTDRVVADPDRPLEGTTWQLESHRGNDAVSHVTGMDKASLRFDGDGLLEVHTGCNQGSATYELDGDTVIIGPVALTRMACPEPAMEIEALLTSALDRQTLTVSVEADRLTLDGDDSGLGLVAVPTPDADTGASTS